MKVKVRYENQITSIEVPDEECTVMINADYEDRLSVAEDEVNVSRRSMQEIMDERFNKPDYNNWHKFDRHRGTPKKQFRKDEQLEDDTDGMDLFPDYTQEIDREEQQSYEHICEVIRKVLKPDQAEILISIVLDEVSNIEYAKRENASESAISHRLRTAKNNFKKVFPKSSTLFFSQGY